MGSQHIPKRRCLGCGAQAPKRDLVRFVAALDPGGRRLVRDDRAQHPGRGLYVCAHRSCFARAVDRRAFVRAARLDGVALRIDTTLAESFEG